MHVPGSVKRFRDNDMQKKASYLSTSFSALSNTFSTWFNS